MTRHRCQDPLCPEPFCWEETECPECGYLFVPDGDICCPECGFPGRLEGVNHVERKAS